MVLVETSDTEKASLIFRQNCREVVVDSPEQCTIAVHQKEYCVIMTPPYSACDGKSLSIATEGCTSCIGLGLSYVDSGTNRTRALLAHLDMVEGIGQTLEDLLKALIPNYDSSSCSRRNFMVSAYIVGGFEGKSQVHDAVMTVLHNSTCKIRLVLNCSGLFNTTSCGKPACRSLGLRIFATTNEVLPFKVRFEGEIRGPKLYLRICRSLCGGSKCSCIHNCNNSCIHGVDLSAFYVTVEHFEKLPSYPLNSTEILHTFIFCTPKRDLISIFSTTPDCEDDRFIDDLRGALLQLLNSANFDGAKFPISVPVTP